MKSWCEPVCESTGNYGEETVHGAFCFECGTVCAAFIIPVIIYMNFVNELMRVMVSCFIISEAHSKYFVSFRDLKIENLLLDEDNNIKLIGMKLVRQFQ